MEYVQKILSALETPHLIFLFALIFIFLFRKPVADLIRRTRSIDRTGLSADPTIENQRGDADPDAVRELLDVVGKSIVITELENRIIADLKGRGLDHEGDSVAILIRHLAGTQLLLSFEQIYGAIFGSQIVLLKRLNEIAPDGRSEEYIGDFVDNALAKYSEFFGEWSREQYMSFLFNYSLIIVQDKKLHITNAGVEYLSWMVRAGRPEDRWL